MTNEIDVLRYALSKYEDALRIKNLNEELLYHLSDSAYYLLKYSEKYDIPLPNKDALLRMVERANFLISEIEAHQPPVNTNKNNHEVNSTLFSLQVPCGLK